MRIQLHRTPSCGTHTHNRTSNMDVLDALTLSSIASRLSPISLRHFGEASRTTRSIVDAHTTQLKPRQPLQELRASR